MGCLSRVGCLVVLAGAAVGGWWVYGDQLPPGVTRTVRRGADLARDAAGRITARANERADDRVAPPRADTNADTRARSIAWATVPAPTMRVPALARLAERTGPVFVTVGAGEAAAWLSSGLPAVMPRSTRQLQVALDGDRLLVRALMDLGELAGDGTLARLLGTAMRGDDTVWFAGQLTPGAGAGARLRVTAMRLKDIPVPSPLIPSVLRRAFHGHVRAGAADDAGGDDLPLPLPPAVADLRIANSRLTFYKAVTTP